MNQDTIWQIIRYALIAAGSFVVGKGYITSDQVTTIIGAVGAVFPIAWGLYVKANTKAVPASTAARSDVPTVSAATGSIQK
ncbi:MAG: hypothetical protein JSS22_03850 [Proteobacteria bacterium]|nr:hypothetical protein [Pseudomonadota bacterium]